MIDFIIIMCLVVLGEFVDIYTSLEAQEMGIPELNLLGIWRGIVFRMALAVLFSGFAGISPIGLGLLGFLAGAWYVAGVHNILEMRRKTQEDLIGLVRAFKEIGFDENGQSSEEVA